MNNFEQNANIREELLQVVEKLKLIINYNTHFTPIERDIILQELRNAYLAVMQCQTVNEVPPIAEKTVKPAIVEPVKKVEPVQPVVVEPVKKVELVQPVVVEPVKKVEPVQPVIVEPVRTEEPVIVVSDKTEPIRPSMVSMQTPIIQETKAKEEELELHLTPIEEEPEPVVVPVEVQAPAPKQEKTASPVVSELEESDVMDFSVPTPEKPQTQKKSLNDLLFEQMDDSSIGTKFQNAKVEDLSKSISLNDKFLFIKVLFNNKGEEFGAAIQKLNQCKNIDEAFAEIEMLKKYYFWDTSSTAYLSLCDLVRRKFK